MPKRDRESLHLRTANDAKSCRHVYDDGGRAAAGYKGFTGDCVVRALAIANDLPYQHVYDELYSRNLDFYRKRGVALSHASPRRGTHKKVFEPYLAELGWKWHACMGRGTGCQVHLRPDELPRGIIIVRLSKHICVVKDGVVYDTHNGSRAGTRCVYGYWYHPDKR